MASRHPIQLAEARMRAVNLMPYMRKIVFSMPQVEVPEIATLAVDKYGRLYYNRAFVEQHNVDHLAFIILHEAYHLFLRHPERLEVADRNIRGIAVDLSVNSALCHGGLQRSMVGEEGCFPEDFNMEENLLAETYYDLLCEGAQQPPPPGDPKGKGKPRGNGSQRGQVEDGQSGEGQGSQGCDKQLNGEGGSAHGDGQKPWEQGPPDSDGKTAPGLDQTDIDELIKDTAKTMLDQKNRGNIPGSILRYCQEIVDPQVDPFKALESKCRFYSSTSPGFGVHTYRKPSRRSLPGGCVLPSHRQPNPEPVVLIDTSGSMDSTDLGLALGAVKRGLRRCGQRLRVVTGDTRIAKTQTVCRPESVVMAGGGGTDVGAMMEQAMTLRPVPTLLVCITDGYTPWPSHQLPVQCVVALTRESERSTVPSWCDVVMLRRSGE